MEFDLEGQRVRAWVWVSVFKDGDEVEVVAERGATEWQAFGVRRINDGIVALHPHCSRGRYAHYKKSAKLFFKVMAIFFTAFYAMGLVVCLFQSLTWSEWKGLLPIFLGGTLISMGIYGVIAYRIASKFMGFVRLAEGIFEGFGWKDVRNIDLPAMTMKSKQPGEPGPLGILYFRYNEVSGDRR
ncbi:hypothetical protein AWB75_06019 [Caballeronia catudaia]|uniref:Uncharacterized protein n=1 Tax=Caballeronia catudaia TaxID=1777136 RepID=A0A158D0M2_9BURK|nr:hypothetical protein AWB75_06019 [Caballeronia catudaia]